MKHITPPKQVKVEHIPLQLFEVEEKDTFALKEQRAVARSEVISAVRVYFYKYGEF